MEASQRQTYHVDGMTCGHCAQAVDEKVARVPGVTRVDVKLDGGRLVVEGEGVRDGEVRAAVAEAGYRVSQS